jgi:mono/diheme cytochrome c family protein
LLKRLLIAIVGIVLIGAIAVVGLSWHSAIAPIAAPAAASFSPQLVEQGAMLAGQGNCAACHTVKGGAQLAGGVPLATPFGTIYSTNITPDPATGIGSWSQAAFKRAMHEGVRQDGAHLFPAFPYTHFSIVNDADLTALYAWLMTRPAVVAPAKALTLPFPLDQRPLQAGWKLLYFDKTADATNAAKSVDWNRGRYLAEGLAHCAACHTPRNALGAERKDDAYRGASIDGWYAPALTAANTTPLPWTEAELFQYLRRGATTLHGSAVGPMSEVVHDGLALSSDADVHALAVYFADMNGSATRAETNAAASATALAGVMARSATVAGQYNNHGATLYLSACASCHSNSDGKPNILRPELGLNSALTEPDPANLIRVILHGVGRAEGMQDVMMPGFAQSLTDADIAELASWLRSRTASAPWQNLATSVAAIRKNSAP